MAYRTLPSGEKVSVKGLKLVYCSFAVTLVAYVLVSYFFGSLKPIFVSAAPYLSPLTESVYNIEKAAQGLDVDRILFIRCIIAINLIIGVLMFMAYAAIYGRDLWQHSWKISIDILRGKILACLFFLSIISALYYLPARLSKRHLLFDSSLDLFLYGQLVVSFTASFLLLCLITFCTVWTIRILHKLKQKLF